jgi:hypothetical protein
MQNKFHIIALLLLFRASAIIAQIPAQWRLTGTVSDPDGVPVRGASILLDERVKATSDAVGNFSVYFEAKPTTITVRRIGYLASKINLDTLRWQNQRARIEIVLDSDNPVLNEVVISANPIQKIFEEDFLTELLDYGFVGGNLLLLVREKKQYFLRYTSNDASIVYSEMRLPNVGAHRIFTSCTGGQHVLGTNVAWEISWTKGQLDTFPRYDAQSFYRLIEPCQVALDGHYFFRKMLVLNQAVHFYYFGPERKRRPLITIVDSVAEANAMYALDNFASGRPFFIPRPIDRGGSSFARPSSGGTGLTSDDLLETSPITVTGLMKYLNPENNDQIYAFGALQNALLDSIYAPMLLLKGRVYIFDHVNDRTLEVSGPDLELLPTPLTYHRATRWKDELIGDAATGKVYGLFGRTSGGYLLKEVDLRTGAPVDEIPLGNIPFLSNRFKVRNGMLYTIGQPDVNIPNKFLYRVRLEQLKP